MADRPVSVMSSETLAASHHSPNMNKSSPSLSSDDGWSDVEVDKPAKPVEPNAIPPTEDPLHVAVQKKYSVFTPWQKRTIAFLAAAAAFCSPLTSQIYFPSLPVIAKQYGVSDTQINLTVTLYMIVQGFIPMFVATFSDKSGRRPSYLICFVIYTIGNIGCALSPNYPCLMFFRFVQAAGASTTMTLCSSVVSDIATSSERGKYVGWTALPIVLAPCVGPIIGGIFAQYLGWEWCFWFLTILSSVILLLLGLFMPETCRNIVEDGSIVPPKTYRAWWPLLKETLAGGKAAKAPNFEMSGIEQKPKDENGPPKGPMKGKGKGVNPLRAFLLVLEPEMFFLLICSSFVYTGFAAISTVMPYMLEELYHYDQIMIGAMYTPMGVGCLFAAVIMGRLQNKNFLRHAALSGIEINKEQQQDLKEFPIEKVRLQLAFPPLFMFILCVISWGWIFQYKATVAVPIVVLFFVGLGMTAFNNSINILLVDINPGIAGAAAAVSNCFRFELGAGISSAISPMINSMGVGWAFSTLGLIYLLTLPLLALVIKNGMVWREKKMIRRAARMKAMMQKQREKAMAEAQKMGAAMQAEAAKADNQPDVPDIVVVPARPPTIDDPYSAHRDYPFLNEEPAVAALSIPDPRLSVWGETGLRGSLWVGNNDSTASGFPSSSNNRRNTNRYSVWNSGEDWVPHTERHSTWGVARNRESIMLGARDSVMFGGF